MTLTTSPKKYIARAPSNIAFLKYWGKRDSLKQWPANDSISMTLSGLNTTTEVSILPENDQDRIILNGEELAPGLKKRDKIDQHLDRLRSLLNSNSKFLIESKNSFPTGCGIASSASGLAALTIAVIAAICEAESMDALGNLDFPRERLADVARLGSGSACRSLWGDFVQWHAGENADAQSCRKLATDDWQLQDTIVIFSEEEKAVGSTDAHRLAWSSPLFSIRLSGLNARRDAILNAIEEKSIAKLGPLIEQEAMEMHAVIMTAEKPVFYFDQKVSEFLSWIRRYRDEHQVPVYFTLDAGSTVHLIYEKSFQEDVEKMLSENKAYEKYITDTLGKGPELWTKEEGE